METDYILAYLVEECAELQKECLKALRFGLYDINPNTNIENIEAIRQEVIDVLALISLLDAKLNGSIVPGQEASKVLIKQKQEKALKYLEVSKECKTIWRKLWTK